MVEKLNHSSCLAKFCWLEIIAQAAIHIVEVVADNGNSNSRFWR